MSRCRLLALAALLLAAGCASVAEPPERIVEVKSGRVVERAELLAAIRASDYTLLGELHDSGPHHQRRGALIAELQAPAAVVAEHLPRGAPVRLGGDVVAGLAAAGFDATGWRWPRHEPLFAGVARAGLPLRGGNLPRDLLRRVAREGDAATPPELAALLRPAPLAAAAQAALDADLLEGHCGQLPAAMLGGLRRAQRARDASLFAALRESGGRPAVLVAGNGHVRRDYGVPQLIAALQPAARVVSVGFAEAGAAVAGEPYDYLWITAATPREDPCAGFTMPAPAATK